MTPKVVSIRPFIGARDYTVSGSFYRALGFEETVLSDNMSVFRLDGLAFYLQKSYVKDWIDNTMVFMEVADVRAYWAAVFALDLPGKYPGVKLKGIREEDWGSEFFLHDPSGVLWHFGQFRRP